MLDPQHPSVPPLCIPWVGDFTKCASLGGEERKINILQVLFREPLVWTGKSGFGHMSPKNRFFKVSCVLPTQQLGMAKSD